MCRPHPSPACPPLQLGVPSGLAHLLLALAFCTRLAKLCLHPPRPPPGRLPPGGPGQPRDPMLSPPQRPRPSNAASPLSPSVFSTPSFALPPSGCFQMGLISLPARSSGPSEGLSVVAVCSVPRLLRCHAHPARLSPASPPRPSVTCMFPNPGAVVTDGSRGCIWQAADPTAAGPRRPAVSCLSLIVHVACALGARSAGRAHCLVEGALSQVRAGR